MRILLVETAPPSGPRCATCSATRSPGGVGRWPPRRPPWRRSGVRLGPGDARFVAAGSARRRHAARHPRDSPALPVVVMSLHPEEEYRAAMRAAGATDYVSKGSSAPAIAAVVRGALGMG